MLSRARGRDVLQVQPRRCAGFVYAPQKRVKIIPAQCRYNGADTAVFIKNMHGAQNGAVTGGTPEFRQTRVELTFVHIAEILLAENGADTFQLLRDGGVFRCEADVIRAGVDGAQRIAAVGEVKINFFRRWDFPRR